MNEEEREALATLRRPSPYYRRGAMETLRTASPAVDPPLLGLLDRILDELDELEGRDPYDEPAYGDHPAGLGAELVMLLAERRTDGLLERLERLSGWDVDTLQDPFAELVTAGLSVALAQSGAAEESCLDNAADESLDYWIRGAWLDAAVLAVGLGRANADMVRERMGSFLEGLDATPDPDAPIDVDLVGALLALGPGRFEDEVRWWIRTFDHAELDWDPLLERSLAGGMEAGLADFEPWTYLTTMDLHERMSRVVFYDHKPKDRLAAIERLRSSPGAHASGYLRWLLERQAVYEAEQRAARKKKDKRRSARKARKRR